MTAVRQCSIADITLSWSKLRCPARAIRYAGPAARKMSATSMEARTPAQPLDVLASIATVASLSNGLVTLRSTRVATCV